MEDLVATADQAKRQAKITDRKALYALLQVVPVCVPRHSIHAGGSHPFEFEVAVLEHFRSDVVQQGGKP